MSLQPFKQQRHSLAMIGALLSLLTPFRQQSLSIVWTSDLLSTLICRVILEKFSLTPAHISPFRPPAPRPATTNPRILINLKLRAFLSQLSSCQRRLDLALVFMRFAKINVYWFWLTLVSFSWISVSRWRPLVAFGSSPLFFCSLFFCGNRCFDWNYFPSSAGADAPLVHAIRPVRSTPVCPHRTPSVCKLWHSVTFDPFSAGAGGVATPAFYPSHPVASYDTHGRWHM